MSRKIFNRLLITVLLVAVVLSFYKLPYYVYKAGSAKELAPMVTVEGSENKEEGSFMLTTVSRLEPNIFIYWWAKIRPFYDIVPQSDVLDDGETQEEFNVYQLFLMERSQINAIYVAYDHAGIPIDYTYHGIYVLGIEEGMPAENVLEPGDQITAVDDIEFESSEEFINYVKEKKAGDPLDITYTRGDKTKKATLKLEAFPEKPDDPNAPKGVGLGIALVDDYEIEVEPSITIDADAIGGPSAGLMFSLEIYNQLTETDWTKGYKIAGTGEITKDGEVKRIGGIDHKIIAADNEGVEIFFAPHENGKDNSNYEVALQIKEKIGAQLTIVPVDTFDDAINYLKQLEPKGE